MQMARNHGNQPLIAASRQRGPGRAPWPTRHPPCPQATTFQPPALTRMEEKAFLARYDGAGPSLGWQRGGFFCLPSSHLRAPSSTSEDQPRVIP